MAYGEGKCLSNLIITTNTPMVLFHNTLNYLLCILDQKNKPTLSDDKFACILYLPIIFELAISDEQVHRND